MVVAIVNHERDENRPFRTLLLMPHDIVLSVSETWHKPWAPGALIFPAAIPPHRSSFLFTERQESPRLKAIDEHIQENA
jgi:hypothetical protein